MKPKPVNAAGESSPRGVKADLWSKRKSATEPEDVHQRFLQELKRKGIKQVVMHF